MFAYVFGRKGFGSWVWCMLALGLSMALYVGRGIPTTEHTKACIIIAKVLRGDPSLMSLVVHKAGSERVNKHKTKKLLTIASTNMQHSTLLTTIPVSAIAFGLISGISP